MILKVESTLLSQAEVFQKYESFDDITWNLNRLYYHELNLSQKFPRFNEVTWILTAILSQAKIFAKNKAVLMISLEHLNYPYYHEIKCTRK